MEDEGIVFPQINTIADKNWNEAWESEYKMVRISHDTIVRAPFHEAVPGVRHDIIIEPRMAFGTAHHETTSQMLRLISALDIKGRSVLDMGCGTAVLAILAYQLGAGRILAVDNDEWAYRNSLDNVELNGAGIEVKMGDAALLQNLSFDIIFANINRNILLEDIPAYNSSLNQSGILLMSGFYEEDLAVIREKAESFGLIMGKTSLENRWMAVEFIKHQAQ
jgi:ribosomal protein L11 methyltransferase